ncbi:hypothetical protein GGI35DRAFT_120985 [Trichoderma velutinum]
MGLPANVAISAIVLAVAIASLPSHPIIPNLKRPPVRSLHLLYTDHGYCWSLLVYLRTTLCHWQMYVARMLLEHLPRVSLANPSHWQQRGIQGLGRRLTAFNTLVRRDVMESC